MLISPQTNASQQNPWTRWHASNILLETLEYHCAMAVVLYALNSGEIPHDLNHTFLTLIAKKKQPLSVAEYHPISLCNVLYKIISKVLGNRIRVYLPMLIFESQSSFVPGRQITNNIVIAYEIVHFLRMKGRGKQDFKSLKFDMSKTYSKVEWDYLEYTLFALGFLNHLIKLIMQCVKMASFSVLINGTPKFPIIPI